MRKRDAVKEKFEQTKEQLREAENLINKENEQIEKDQQTEQKLIESSNKCADELIAKIHQMTQELEQLVSTICIKFSW